MAYNTEELYNLSVKHIETENLFFMEDVIAFLGISKATFYDHFNADSNELNYFKELLTKNKVSAKLAMRKKWQDSDNASLQMGLYKLIGSDEERKRLNSAYIDQKTEVKGELKIVREIVTHAT